MIFAILEILGAAIVVAGIAFICWPAAIIVGGLAVIAVGAIGDWIFNQPTTKAPKR